MFSDPQFWVSVAFIVFILVIFHPIRKTLKSSLDSKIDEIKNKIEEAENLKSETQINLSNIKKRQNEVKKEIEEIHLSSKEKINLLETKAKEKLNEQINKREILLKSKLDQISRDANSSIQQMITNTTIEATVAILEKKLNQEEKQNLINQSIKDTKLVLKN